MILSRVLHPTMLTRYGRYSISTKVPNPFAHHHDDHGDHHGEEHHHPKGHRPPVEFNTISAHLDHKNLFTYFEQGPGYMKYPGVEYYPAHAKPYDWRDDPKYNEDITQLSRHKGCPDPQTYVWPFEGRSEYTIPGLTVSQDHLYSPHLLLKLENQKVQPQHTNLKAAEWDPESEVNHEFDYESEDCDFQCESFKTQHFRKRGPLTPWVICALAPFIYFWAEFLFQHYPDEDHWKITHPPPLNFPDTEDTDDTDTYNDYHKPEGKYLRDIGQIGELWFDIKDGKKVYNRWAGVNQPLPNI